MKKHTIHRLEWIDSLRGLAALGVVIMHLYQHLRSNYPAVSYYQTGSIPGLLIEDFFNLGKVGVIVFFFISGYVIPFSLQNKDLKQFTVTRFFRLYPAYWVSIILSIIVFGIPPLMKLLANVTMFQKFIGIDDMIGVYWTLQIELMFYFICGSLFYIGILYNSKTIVNGFYFLLLFSLILAAARYVSGIKLPVAAPLGLTIMFIGMIFRKFLDKESGITWKQVAAYIGCFEVALLIVCFLAYNRDYGYNESWYSYFVSYSAAIGIFLIFSKYKWSNKYLLYLGSISYSLYLLHPVMGLGLMEYLKENHFPELSAAGYTFLYFFFSLGSATLCYYFIEKPAIALGKRVYLYRMSLRFDIGKK